jgi:hypothetical protein
MKERKKGLKAGNEFPGIQILNGDGVMVFDGPLNELRFSEHLVIAKSIFFFHDKEPCFIHRSAVMARLFAELGLIIKQDVDIPVEELEKTCPGYFDEYPGAALIRRKRV